MAWEAKGRELEIEAEDGRTGSLALSKLDRSSIQVSNADCCDGSMNRKDENKSKSGLSIWFEIQFWAAAERRRRATRTSLV